MTIDNLILNLISVNYYLPSGLIVVVSWVLHTFLFIYTKDDYFQNGSETFEKDICVPWRAYKTSPDTSWYNSERIS